MDYMETRIAKRVIKDCLAADYAISVYDGEAVCLEQSTDKDAIFKAMGSTDEDWLRVHKRGHQEALGWVRFIYGNDGWDVVNDYTTNLEAVMEGANALAEEMSE